MGTPFALVRLAMGPPGHLWRPGQHVLSWSMVPEANLTWKSYLGGCWEALGVLHGVTGPEVWPLNCGTLSEDSGLSLNLVTGTRGLATLQRLLGVTGSKIKLVCT